MRKLSRFFLNICLVVLSVAFAVVLFVLADCALGLVLPEEQWPGTKGMIFQPRTQEEYRMHDYSCSESINSLGFRGEEVPVRKERAYRLLAIGDSFTYGWGVNIEDTWEKQAEAMLRAGGLDLEFLDLGKPAAGPLEYAEIAETVIPVLKPDMIVIGVLNGDDLMQSGPDVLHPSKALLRFFPNFRRAIGLWKFRGYLPADHIQKTTVEETNKRFVNVAKGLLTTMKADELGRLNKLDDEVKQAFHDGTLNPWLLAHSGGSPDYFLPTIDVHRMKLNIWYMGQHFARIKKVADKYHVRVLVVSLPEGFYVNNLAYKNVQRIGFDVVPQMLTTDVPDRAIQSDCDRNKFPFVSVLDGFRKHADEPLYFELDRHMNPAGNKLFAELILPALQREIGQIKPLNH